MFFEPLLISWLWTLTSAIALILLWRITTAIARAPLLDVVVSLVTWIPWVVAAIDGGWIGLFGCIVGQFIGLQTFIILHELAHPGRTSTIRAALDRYVGPVRNHLGLWVTIPALPIFLGIRMGEVVLYPMLRAILGFPPYRQGEWVNVSRQKFEGLVGHDLIWCLYCDWMTGVYSLGGEMLRNVESFWCPIQFSSTKKCDNCKMAFPDISKWVRPDATMKDVEDALDEHYSNKPGTPRSWWGHPERTDHEEEK